MLRLREDGLARLCSIDGGNPLGKFDSARNPAELNCPLVQGGVDRGKR
jgi:hypothetical protein